MAEYQSLKKEYEQIKSELSQPATSQNPARLKELSQRYGQLTEVVDNIIQLEKLEKQLAEANDTITSETEAELVSLAQAEQVSLSDQIRNLRQTIDQDLKPVEPLANHNIIMEIRAGAGGDEASLFAADLFRLYSRYAERQGWKVKILSRSRIGLGGFKEIIFEIKGQKVYGQLQYESGVHRVQRVPATEKSGRIHTSAATVAVLPEAEAVDLEIKAEDLRIDVFRAGGHGGQSVNTTDSAVRITHLPTGTVVTCQDEKSQHQNKAKALQIIRSRILAHQQEKQRRELSEQRKSQIGSGDRSEKIRTYNFPQDRLTDHRLKQSWHGLASLMDGAIGPIIAAIQAAQ